MKKDEIIELLKEQIKGLRDDNNRLLDQIDALIKEVSSLKEALLQKGESLSKQQRLTKGLAKLVSNTSEQQQAPQSAISEEERQKIEAEKADKRKARKNNGAKRDMHYEMEEEEHVVYPDDPDFDINKARLFTTVPRICVRYECVPMRFIKHVYKIHTYAQDGRLFEGKIRIVGINVMFLLLHLIMYATFGPIVLSGFTLICFSLLPLFLRQCRLRGGAVRMCLIQVWRSL